LYHDHLFDNPQFTMSTQAEIQEKIAAARREADMLKDKIRQRKDQTSDTSRECRHGQKL